MPGSAYRLLFYCQDSAGLGHVRRAVTLATRLLQVFPQAEALILMRGAATHGLFALPPRCDFVKLPALAQVGPDERGEIRMRASSEPARYRHLRAAVIREVIREFQPHLFHVDNEPVGLQDELLPTLTYLSTEHPQTAVVFGLRDIRGTAEHVRRNWTDKGIYTALERFYHRILVYGERDIFDVAAEYTLHPAIASRVTYCSYIVQSDPPQPEHAVRQTFAIPPDVPLVAVTAGSGADGLPLIQAYLAALPQLVERRRLHSLIITGPLMREPDRVLLHQAVTWGFPLTVRETFDTYTLMAAARAVICRGGYNSMAEAISLGRRPLVVPRRTQSGEQELRASLFAARGWCEVLPEDALKPERLAGAVVDLLDRPPAPVPRIFTPGQALARVEAAIRLVLEGCDG